MTKTFTATASNGQTISRNTSKDFAFCIAYMNNGVPVERAAWASDAVKAERVAASMRRMAAIKGCMVSGFKVEVLKAEARA